MALRSAPGAERDAATELLAQGLARAADPDHAFWPALRRAMGAVEPGVAAFARQMDGWLSMLIAQAKAPQVPAEAAAQGGAPAAPAAPSTPTAETRPGG